MLKLVLTLSWDKFSTKYVLGKEVNMLIHKLFLQTNYLVSNLISRWAKRIGR